jgi:hypothetical protein
LPAAALLLSSCVVVAKKPENSPSNPPPPQPAHNDPPPPQPGPSPFPPGISQLPPGTRWFHDKLEMKYDAALEACYNASRKALGFMKFTEADMEKKSGELIAYAGTIATRVTMYRRNHHTYLTFYFRVHGARADARMPGDFAKRCHDYVGKEVKEEGRRTD